MVFGDVESPEEFFHLTTPRTHFWRMGIVGFTVLHPSQFILKGRTLSNSSRRVILYFLLVV